MLNEENEPSFPIIASISEMQKYELKIGDQLAFVSKIRGTPKVYGTIVACFKDYAEP